MELSVSGEASEFQLDEVTRYLSVYGRTVWQSKPPPKSTPSHSSPLKVVTFANNKGGVGKTTLAANYAYHRSKSGDRVLMIDMDYQGSMTSTALAATGTASRSGVPAQERTTAYSWLDDSFEPKRFLDNLTKLRCFHNGTMSLLEAGYDLSTEEDRRLFLWLTSVDETDIRFRLSKLIWSEVVSSEYDIIVIDAPPKLSVGSLNGLIASTHYVVPTILDTLSATPIRLLLQNHADIFGYVGTRPKLCGVAAVKTRTKNLNENEIKNINTINQLLESRGLDTRVFETHIPFSVKYARAAGRQFVLDEATVGGRLRCLFEELDAAVGVV